MRFLLAVLFAVLLSVVLAADIEKILSRMSLTEKVGQMTQIDINAMLTKESNSTEPRLAPALATEWIASLKIGSILDSPFSSPRFAPKVGWTAQEWRDVISELQDIANKNDVLPIIYGIDSIHGASYVYGATLFPQQIGLAATFNLDLAYEMGEIKAKDTRAAGIPWAFSPVLGLSTMPLWARVFETFGEDPFLAGQMGVALIKGIQADPEDDSLPPKVAACMKHFVGYPPSLNGHDRSTAWLPHRMLKQLYARPFHQAIKEGEVLTAMESYNEIAGVPVVSSKQYLIDLLRHEMRFEGLLVTDYAEIENLKTFHKIVPTLKEAVKMTMLETSVDMSMVPLDPSFPLILKQLVEEGSVPEERIDESVRRILNVKNKLGLLENPLLPANDPLVDTVGQDEDWQKALNAARESVTLLKNDGNSLPFHLPEDENAAYRILLAGAPCDSLVYQTGGWSYHWQGPTSDAEIPRGYTIKQALEMFAEGKPNVEILFHEGVTDMKAETDEGVDYDSLDELMQQAHVVVMCAAEHSYAEKPGDIEDLNLPNGQVTYMKKVVDYRKETGLVLLEGRPRLLQGLPDLVRFVLHGYLPGPMGGQAIAEILLGHVNPSGRLPLTYPKRPGNIPHTYYHTPSSLCTDPNDPKTYVPCEVEWPFGAGLSYSTFAYSNMRLSATELTLGTSIDVTVTVTNEGDLPGMHSVLLFLSDMYRRTSPEYKLLRGFQKVSLNPGQAADMSFRITTEDLFFAGLTGRYQLEAGDFRVGLGPDVDCRAEKDVAKNPLCGEFTLELPPSYSPSCDSICEFIVSDDELSMCDLRDEDGAFVTGITEQEKREVCASLCQEQGWGWGNLDCLENYAYTPMIHRHAGSEGMNDDDPATRARKKKSCAKCARCLSQVDLPITDDVDDVDNEQKSPSPHLSSSSPSSSSSQDPARDAWLVTVSAVVAFVLGVVGTTSFFQRKRYPNFSAKQEGAGRSYPYDHLG